MMKQSAIWPEVEGVCTCSLLTLSHEDMVFHIIGEHLDYVIKHHAILGNRLDYYKLDRSLRAFNRTVFDASGCYCCFGKIHDNIFDYCQEGRKRAREWEEKQPRPCKKARIA